MFLRGKSRISVCHYEVKAMTKIRECDHCGEDVEVPDDLDDDIAVLCSKQCSYAEAGW